MAKMPQATGTQGVAFTKAPCVVKRCSCVNPGQDRMYGTGMRVFNPSKNGHRCTSCGAGDPARSVKSKAFKPYTEGRKY